MMRYLKMEICLPPGLLSLEMVREILSLVFEEFRWFTPTKYGYFDFDHRLFPGQIGIDGMLAYYEERKHLWVARSNHEYINISPTRVDEEYPYVGGIGWTTREKPKAQPKWPAAPSEQVKKLMTLVGSPHAYVALDRDIDQKKWRLVPHEIGYSEVHNVRDYSEGLAGLFWRNFFGPPFVHMFGDRLRTLPPDVRTDLGDDIVLVEPYPLPSDAETEEGKARERALIEHLGPECFYDHERHTAPTRRPDVSSLPRPKGSRFPKP